MTDSRVVGAEVKLRGSSPHRLIASWRDRDVTVPDRNTWSRPLRMVNLLGLATIVIEFLGLAKWSSQIADRFSLTSDMSFYNQGWFEIAHGKLDPYSSVIPPSFWHNAMELVMWPLAALWYLWPHTVTLLWAQDAATAGCEAILLIWMCELAAVAETRDQHLRQWIAVLPLSGLVMMMVNPWVIWINSFDFHPEAIALLTTIIAARALWKGNLRLAWVAAAVTLLSGAIGATYVVGVGLSALVVRRRLRQVGIGFIALGILWLLFMWTIRADTATTAYLLLANAMHIKSITAFHLIGGMLAHPGAAVHAIWSVRTDIVANLSSGAIIGLFNPWTAGIAILVLAEGALTGSAQFIQPAGENSLPVLLMVPFGTIAIVIAIATVRRWWTHIGAIIFVLAAVLNSVGWSMTWMHRTNAQWIAVDAESATVLNRTLALIHANDEVIVSQGVAGRFAHRQYLYLLITGPRDTFPVVAKTVWFIVTPTIGIETETSTAAQIQLGQIAALPNNHLIVDSKGVFAFKWTPSRKVHSLTTIDSNIIPVWTLGTSIGHIETSGAPSKWRIVSPSVAGVVMWGDYWRLNDGAYTASARLASTGPFKVQLWDVTLDKMLATHTFVSTAGVERSMSFTGVVHNRAAPVAFAGDGIFRILPVEPFPGDILELRIINPGRAFLAIYDVGLINTHHEGGAQ